MKLFYAVMVAFLVGVFVPNALDAVLYVLAMVAFVFVPGVVLSLGIVVVYSVAIVAVATAGWGIWHITRRS